MAMQSDAIRLLTTAIAVSVPQDRAAYEMLQKSFIEPFESFYREKSYEAKLKGAPSPTYLDELLNYTLLEIPIRYPECQSLTELQSDAKKTEIKHRFIQQSEAQMLTALATRDTIKSSIRQVLHANDRQNNHAAIDSTKFDKVFSDFITMFEESCASSFRYEGDFVAFVVFSFNRYYYTSHLRDIWRTLKEVDLTRREAETNKGTIKVVDQVQDDDLDIHDLLLNIVEVNDFIFFHSGHSADARGVCYDIVYMLINHLCQEKVNKLNELLPKDSFRLALIDEKDRKESRGDLLANKSIASKISNAKEIVPFLFDCIRSGNWSLDTIADLRDEAFYRGKKDRDGKNCVWKDVVLNAETARYFDAPMTAHNYRVFDLIFKGTLSAYALMKAFEVRGLNLIEMYDKLVQVLSDKALSRVVYSIEDLNYLDLISQLQNEPDDGKRSGELLQFDEMVYTYAGSPQNKKPAIQEYRYQSMLKGLLDNPQLKQKGTLQTQIQQLKSVAEYLTSIPMGHGQYLMFLASRKELPACIAPKAKLLPNHVVGGRYSIFYNNIFLASNPTLSNYYLYKVLEGEEKIETWEWHLGTGNIPCIDYQEVAQNDQGYYVEHTYGLYVAMAGKFLMCPDKEPNPGQRKFYVEALTDIQNRVYGMCFDGQQTAQVITWYAGLPKYLLSFIIPYSENSEVDEREQALKSSISFDAVLGFGNISAASVQTALEKIEIYPKYKGAVTKYIQWYNELSELQNSFIDLLQMMISYGLYTGVGSESVEESKDIAMGKELVVNLLKTEFREDVLEWFFAKLKKVMGYTTPQKVDFAWNEYAKNGINFVDADLRCMEYIWKGSPNFLGEVSQELQKVLEPYSKPSQRFIQMYNFLKVKLNFIRVLRDAFDLSFNAVSLDLSTLFCEIDSKFKITETIENASKGLGDGGIMEVKCALLDTLSIEDVTRFVNDQRYSNWSNFAILLKDFLGYFEKHRQSISSYLDYEVTTSNELYSKFQDYGSLFYATGPYTEPFVLSLCRGIRASARTDSVGFILTNNSYLKGVIGRNEYFIHITGRLLRCTDDELVPETFNFSNERDRMLYEDIIKDAKERNAWQ